MAHYYRYLHNSVTYLLPIINWQLYITIMLTIDQFISKYFGKQVEYHSYNSNALYQCTDLANLYIKEVLNLTPIIGTNAKDFPSKIGDEFEFIKNTPDLIPKKGWIAIWNGRVGGGAGHIAVVRDDKATTTSFNSIDQNWSKPLFVTLETHNYNSVSGFLVPTTQNDMTDIVKKYGLKTIEELDSKIFEHVGLDWGNENNLENKSYLASERRKNKSLQAELEKKQAEIEQVKGEVVEKASALKTVREELKEFIETLASKLVTIADKSEIIGAIDRLLDNEDKLKKNISQLEKAYSLLESEKKEEITSLKEAIATMKSEYEKALERVEKLETRVKELEGKDKVSETEKAVFTRIEKLIEIIKGLFNDKTKTK
jgi:iron-sulfur cluster repair protein YtfE (RIC family)